ncbi:Sec-independent protein secretion pathway component [Longilinea arvoryzae]|uniref:Sec-independent protein translocase protein TatA n=1 Tax=Longilinea arvoryzae TaxID=360412 RepID=A0A0S7BD16_9CHLR|nr:twin-arginine translocase TatA/TatE family subunit [Longilinea arvoryzae]GAP12323.1 Sec-independent protein secretion pathway component [Longilinea arvoryzae]
MGWRPGLPEILLILAIVLLLFGPGRIVKIANELGSSIKAFRDGLQKKDDSEEDKPQDETKK